MNDTILIVSNKGDITSDLVIKRLHERNIPFVRFNTESFPLQTKGVMTISNKSTCYEIRTSKKAIVNERIKSVWYRRPVTPDISSVKLKSEDIEFAIRENIAFLQNYWACLADVRWINNPFSLHKVEQKAFQLKVASELGFLIPQTMISNVYESILSFAVNCKNGFVVKPLSHGALGEADEKAIFTNEINIDSINNLKESINLCPFIIQEKITKECDVRVTVFSDNVFAHRILPKTGLPREVDWRLYKPHELLYNAIRPPEEVSASIRRFMVIMNISYGAFDFCITPKGDWFFIEVNPSGQFAWIEIATGDKLIDSLIDMLAQ